MHLDHVQIADCNALIVARIARNDLPSQWTSLIPDLAGIIQTNVDAFMANPTNTDPSSILILKRALGTLNQIVKELAKMKMLSGVRVMTETAEALYSPLVSYYAHFSRLLQSSFSANSLLDPNLQYACEEVVILSHMIFKPCVKIMLWLWQKASQPQFAAASQTMQHKLASFSESCFPLAESLFDLRIQTVIALQQAMPEDSRSTFMIPEPTVKAVDQLTRHIRLFAKMFRRMQQLNFKRFVGTAGANDFVLYFWREVVKAAGGPAGYVMDSSEAVYPIRLLILGMVLFRESLNSWSGRGNPEKITNVMSPQSIEEAVKLLLTRFIPLTPADLEKWSNDPEELGNTR
ncbi:hypothetical protein M422DRAFT_260016 [Sphaerobolus stellatus SS14]|uniref:Unplaced genomic scaffold SPHSTscaffold_94, whole genome shotgun sequence n=1 Tax=Sphaerobolus stellatus (strain SS14) TaxID=990650 RepID=A0A0C9VIJ2_SPHS4|nr:hypothetical protein M422DRAFT_260016 [Sphaerobolus stellatus SS14]